MSTRTGLLTSRRGVILTGVVIGVLAPLLVKAGNPGNMGVCVACFSRDIAGAIGLHRAAPAQYIRPEIVGFVFGALAAALAFGEFRPRAGASPLARFLLGMFAVIGALVFLGCPWRAYLRLAGGDWTAIPGILGLAAGILPGVFLIRRGFSLGRSRPAPFAMGWLWPAVMAALLALLAAAPLFGRDAAGQATGPIFFSASGPGAQHAPLLLSLGAGLLVGFLAQRSRFCTVGALRDVLVMKNVNLFAGVAALLVVAAATNAALGQFRPGFSNQPLAHTDHLWSFLGMALAGLAFTMAGGCPGRQFFLTGEGDGDAAIFCAGMIVGAAVAHNFNFVSTAAGVAPYGPAAVIVGLLFCAAIGVSMREPAA